MWLNSLQVAWKVIRARTCLLVRAVLVLSSRAGRQRPRDRAAAPCRSRTRSSGVRCFRPGNWWNLDVSAAPLDSNSAAFISFISGRSASNPTATRQLHPDFGPPPYGIPYVVVSGDQPLVAPTWTAYGSESDNGAPGRPPAIRFPTRPRRMANYIEGGVVGGGSSGDRHLLIIDRDHWLLFETGATRWNATLSRWEANCGAIFDMNRSDRRPETWTSADAAGLAIFPGLIRYDEAFGAGGDHARLSRHRAIDQRLRLARVARSGIHGRRAADGHAAAHEGVEEPVRLHARAAAHVPRDEALRPDRRRQRLGHV